LNSSISIQVSISKSLLVSSFTYVAAAAIMSAIPVRVVAISASEKSTVKMAIVQRHLAILAIVYSRIVEVIGNTHARSVLIAQVRRRKVALS
jgi:hypothetical protein